MRVEEGFQQPVPQPANGFSDDAFLQSLLKHLLPDNIQPPIFQDLTRLGDDINGPIRELGLLADQQPTLTQHSHYGRRIDILQTSEGWRRLKSVSQREGVVSISYTRPYGSYSRLYAMTKTLLLTAEGRVIGCPLSMTDGCARVIELLGNEEMKRNILPRLVSEKEEWEFTAGQFMTERPGGSDVSLTETVATPVEEVTGADYARTGAKYRLNGFKWFSSATDAEVALALARTGPIEQGSKSLSLFLLPLRLPLPGPGVPTPTGVIPRTPNVVQGEKGNNGILIHRLKNKIGTHSLPTAELELNDSLAYLVGPLNGGVKAISTVLQITRVHSALHSTGSLARSLAIAKEFAKVRKIDRGQRLLLQVPLHVSSLAKVEVTYRAVVSFTLNVAHLLGQTETLTSSPSLLARFRLLNPTLKAFATHHCIPAIEECMAALGGQGYMEETGIGRLLRDAIVERIWEGTENVLAVDLIRAARGKGGEEPLQYWVEWAKEILARAGSLSGLKKGVEVVSKVVHSMPSVFAETAKTDALAHQMLLLFGHTTSAVYLLEHALWASERNEADKEVHVDCFVRWVMEGGVIGAGLEEIFGQFEGLKNQGDRVRRDRALVFGVGEEKSRL